MELLEYPAVHIQIVIEAGNDDAADGEKVQIQYWHINSENQGGAAVQEFIDTFNASQDEIEVEAGSTPAMMSCSRTPGRYRRGQCALHRPGVLVQH